MNEIIQKYESILLILENRRSSICIFEIEKKGIVDSLYTVLQNL